MTTYAGYGVTYLTELRAIAEADRCPLMCIAVLEKKAWYQFSAEATDTADNNLIVSPNEGTGRWFAMGTPSSGDGGGGGGGGLPIYRSYAGNPLPGAEAIVPDYPGQMYVGGDVSSNPYATRIIWIAFGTTADSWISIYQFSDS